MSDICPYDKSVLRAGPVDKRGSVQVMFCAYCAYLKVVDITKTNEAREHEQEESIQKL